MISETIINSCYRKYDNMRINDVDNREAELQRGILFDKLFEQLNDEQKSLLTEFSDGCIESLSIESFNYFKKGLEVGKVLGEINNVFSLSEIEKIFDL